METVKQIIKAANDFYSEINNDKNGRYRSWEYCYYNFYKARKSEKVDVDYLSLQLAFYLASWGMYRGSSFLLQKDYKVHIPVVEELLKKRYDVLFGVDCDEFFNEETQKKFNELNDFIKQYYDRIRRGVKGTCLKYSLSATLISKVLMGTMGCVPAYDRYFVAGVKKMKVATGTYNVKSISQLANFYKEHLDVFEQERKNFMIEDILYPQMKLLDMGFWKIGEYKEQEGDKK